jgi:hypothetical protein
MVVSNFALAVITYHNIRNRQFPAWRAPDAPPQRLTWGDGTFQSLLDEVSDSIASTTPNSLERRPMSALAKPSAAKPRFSNSRTAAARLGMRRENRQLSSAAISSLVNMIWRRSPRVISPTISNTFCVTYSFNAIRALCAMVPYGAGSRERPF